MNEIEALRAGVPAFPPGVSEFLEENVPPRSTYIFEWGAGGSTFFYLRKFGGNVVSVDHFPPWYSTVAEALKGTIGCNLILVSPTSFSGAGFDPSDPFSYQSAGSGYRRKFSFKGYSSSIDRYLDALFDLVSIDGRARPSCLLHALRKIRPGGYLLLDNSERDRYARAITLVDEWPHWHFDGVPPGAKVPNRCTIWRKP